METRVTYDWHTVNSNVAIWARDKDEVEEQDYQNFYHAISKTPGDSLSHIHFKAEGEVEFKSLLFVPETAGTLYDDYHNMKAGIRLYVRKVSRHCTPHHPTSVIIVSACRSYSKQRNELPIANAKTRTPPTPRCSSRTTSKISSLGTLTSSAEWWTATTYR
jgi:hypothetical protein